jgi:hypothetical protein
MWFPNHDKNVPEQKAMTVETGGYEEAFEDIKRQDVKPASEIVEILKKKFADVTSERDNLSNDKPGLLDAKQLQKISKKAGRDLETIVQRYNTIIQGAVESGDPVPIGTYAITKPDMKLVPVRIMVDFDRKKIKMSLWEKKLQSLI